MVEAHVDNEMFDESQPIENSQQSQTSNNNNNSRKRNRNKNKRGGGAAQEETKDGQHHQ